MKTLKNHVLIYDSECPLCDLYTHAFTKTGLLDKDGREAYCPANPAIYPQINPQRSCDEIALVNKNNGEVMYGIDSLFKIFSNSFPILSFLFEWQMFRWLMRKLYFFISFNRKVIAPSNTFESAGGCTPTFNLSYRLIYIFVSWAFTSFILTAFATRLRSVVPSTNFYREWLICGGQILFQSMWLVRNPRLVHYLGNMMTVSNIGAILLIPSLIFPTEWPAVFYVGWFGVVVGIMFSEHVRRCKILRLSFRMSWGWIAYRSIIVMIMFL